MSMMEHHKTEAERHPKPWASLRGQPADTSKYKAHMAAWSAHRDAAIAHMDRNVDDPEGDLSASRHRSLEKEAEAHAHAKSNAAEKATKRATAASKKPGSGGGDRVKPILKAESGEGSQKSMIGDYDLSKARQERSGTIEPLPHNLKKSDAATPTITAVEWGPSTINVTPDVVDGYAVLNRPGQSLEDKQAQVQALFGDGEAVEIDERGNIPGTKAPYGVSY
jgi:hypothetical protein